MWVWIPLTPSRAVFGLMSRMPVRLRALATPFFIWPPLPSTTVQGSPSQVRTNLPPRLTKAAKRGTKALCMGNSASLADLGSGQDNPAVLHVDLRTIHEEQLDRSHARVEEDRHDDGIGRRHGEHKLDRPLIGGGEASDALIAHLDGVTGPLLLARWPAPATVIRPLVGHCCIPDGDERRVDDTVQGNRLHP